MPLPARIFILALALLTAPLGATADEPATKGTSKPAGRKPPLSAQLGMVQTRVYGLEGEGSKFVYVFDHSASMGGPGNSPLRAAKAELLASLKNLGPTHQFQIIFYNERPTIFNLAGHPNRLVFGTDQNKEQAEQFVEGIKADGGTDHEAALDIAMNLRPDVIFFLTDANEPAMTASQLARIRRRNPDAMLNTIEFGQGPRATGESFLGQLARENRGGYTYIDVTKDLGER